jgi:hypothetical protein
VHSVAGPGGEVRRARLVLADGRVSPDGVRCVYLFPGTWNPGGPTVHGDEMCDRCKDVTSASRWRAGCVLISGCLEPAWATSLIGTVLLNHFPCSFG